MFARSLSLLRGMYHETANGLYHLSLDGMHSDTCSSDSDCGGNARTKEIRYNSMDTPPAAWTKPLSDSDSGDSLFLTQQNAQPVRAVRRRRPEENAVNQFAIGEVDYEDGESASPARRWRRLRKPGRSRKYTPLRRRKLGHKRLSRRKSLSCGLAALGGFFKCVVKMQAKDVKVSKHAKKEVYLDTKRCRSPLSNSGDGEDNEDRDIKIVDLKEFISGFNLAQKAYNPWLEQNDALLCTGIEENKEASEVTPDILDTCSELSGCDTEAGSWENECSDSESESQPVQCSSSESLNSSVMDASDGCFQQDTTQQKAGRASNSEMNTGVEKLMKNTANKQCTAGKRPPPATMAQAEASEEEGRTDEHLQLCDLPVTQLLDLGDLGVSQGKEMGGEEEEGEGSICDAALQRDRDKNKGQRMGSIEKSAGRKKKILSVPLKKDEIRGTWENGETNIDLQDSVNEGRANVPDLVQLETEHVEIYAAKVITQSIMVGQRVGLQRGQKLRKREETADKEPIDLLPDSVPAEEGIAGGAAEPDPHTPPHREHQNPDCSGVEEEECSLVNSNILEPIGDSAPGDGICEGEIRKRKKKRKKDNSGNVEECTTEPQSETFRDCLHLTQDQEKNSGLEVEPPSKTFRDSLHLTLGKEKKSYSDIGGHSHFNSSILEHKSGSASGDARSEERIRKKEKKKRRKNNNGNVEVCVNEPPPETFNNSLHLRQDKEENYGVGVECSVLVSSASEPACGSASGDVICEEGMRKMKKKRKSCVKVSVQQTKYKEKSPTAHIGGRSLLNSNVLEPIAGSASGDAICEKGMIKKKKKRISCANVEEEVFKPQFQELKDSVQQAKHKEKSYPADQGGCSLLNSNNIEPVSDSASGDVLCEGLTKKKKKKRKNDNENVQTHANESQSETFGDSLHLTQDKDRSSGVGVSEFSVLVPGVSEPVGDYAGEGIRIKKKKSKKKYAKGNVEEPANESSSESPSGNLHLTQDMEKSSGIGGVHPNSLLSSNNIEPFVDSASGDALCKEGLTKNKKKKRKNDNKNVQTQANEILSATFRESLHLTQHEDKNYGVGVGEFSVLVPGVSEPVGDCVGTVIYEGIRKKKKKIKKKEDANGNVEEPVNEPPSESLSGSLHLTHDIEKSSGSGVGGVRSIFSCNVRKTVGDSASGDVICEEAVKKKKKKGKKGCGSEGEHVNEPPSHTRKERQPKTQDKNQRADEGKYSHSNFSIQEPINDSTCGNAICQKEIRKKRKKRKRDN